MVMALTGPVTASWAVIVPPLTGYLSFDQLDDDVVILATSGQEILLDPGEKMCPFQALHWSHSGASGARQSPDAHYAATTPLQYYKPNSLVRIGDVNVDEHGAITGAFRFIMTGQDALYWRRQLCETIWTKSKTV